MLKMAALCKVIRECLSKKRLNNLKFLSSNVSGKQCTNNRSFPMIYIIGGAMTLYTAYKCRHSLRVHAIQAKSVSYAANIA